MSNIKRNLLSNAKKEIIDLMTTIRGPKILILDPTLTKMLDISLDYKIKSIKDLGVTDIHYLESIVFDPDNKAVIYFIRENQQNIKNVIDQINQYSPTETRKYYVFAVPKLSLIFKFHFEREGLYGKCELGELKYTNLLPITQDILSMELPLDQNTIELFNDPRVVSNIGATLKKLGNIPEICGIGIIANKIANYLQYGIDATNDHNFDKLIIIDRQYDLITPLSIPVTYEGVVAELFPDVRFETKTDKLSDQIKYMSCGEVAIFLGDLLKKFKGIQNDHEEFKKKVNDLTENSDNIDNTKKLIELMKTYPKKVIETHMALLENVIVAYNKELIKFLKLEEHIKIGNDMNKIIEDYMNASDSLTNMLRLLCLTSLYNCNIDFNVHIELLVKMYGTKCFIALERLKEYGLLKLKTLGDKLTEFISEESHTTIPEIVSEFFKKRKKPVPDSFNLGKPIKHKTNKVLVFIAGGITFDEIAKLKKMVIPGIKIYVASTRIITGTDFIKSFYII